MLPVPDFKERGRGISFHSWHHARAAPQSRSAIELIATNRGARANASPGHISPHFLQTPGRTVVQGEGIEGFQTDLIFGYLLILGVLGLTTDQAMKYAGRRVFRYLEVR